MSRHLSLPILALLGLSTLPAMAAEPARLAEVLAAEPRDNRLGLPYFAGAPFDDPAAAPAVLQRLSSMVDAADVRAALADRLSDLDVNLLCQAAPTLLPTEPDPHVRAVIIEGSRRGNAPDVATLVGLGARDPEAGVRAAAARVIGAREDGAGQLEILPALLGDPDPEVRASAAEALGRRAVLSRYADVAGLLQDADAQVRRKALRAMERLDPVRAAREPAVQRLMADPDPGVARSARRIVEPH